MNCAELRGKLGHVGNMSALGNPKHPLSQIRLWGLKEEKFETYPDDDVSMGNAYNDDVSMGNADE